MRAVRRSTVVLAAIVFAAAWTALVLQVLSPTSALLIGDWVDHAVTIYLLVTLSLFVAACVAFCMAHWRCAWPFGGFGRIPGRRGWTIAFLSGVALLALSLAFSPFVATSVEVVDSEGSRTVAPEALKVVGEKDGPTSIFITYQTDHRRQAIHSTVLGVLAFVSVVAAFRVEKK